MTTMTEQRTVQVGHPGAVVVTEMPVYEYSGVEVVLAPNGKVFESCQRCEIPFSGCIPAFGYVMAGVCFRCMGSGIGKAHESLAAAAKTLAVRATSRAASQRRKEAKWAAQAAKGEAEFTAWSTVNPELTTTLTELADRWSPRDGEYDYENEERVDGWLREDAIRVRNRQIPKHEEAVADLLAEYLAGREAKAATVYAGEVGDVVTVTGEVSVALVVDGIYGSSVMIVLTNGPVTVKTYSTAKWAWAAERGDLLTLTGTVKKLDEYDGVKQTVLARPKVTS